MPAIPHFDITIILKEGDFKVQLIELCADRWEVISYSMGNTQHIENRSRIFDNQQDAYAKAFDTIAWITRHYGRYKVPG